MSGTRSLSSRPDRAVGPIAFAVPDIDDNDVDAVVEVLRSGWLTTGQVNADFEADLAGYLRVGHVATTSSCTTALHAAIASLELSPGSKIAVPTWTFVSTVSTIIHAGHRPVLVDSAPGDLNMAVDGLRLALDDGCRAAIAVHFAGVPVDERVHALCADRAVPLIEDAAHALGTRLDPHRPRWAACYSFYATKNLTTAEGGAVATPHEGVDRFVRAFRLHGLSADAWRRYAPDGRPLYDVEMAGIKGNLPDLLAALGRSQLRRFDSLQSRRRALVRRYHVQLAQHGIRTLPESIDPASANHLLVIGLEDQIDRTKVVASLAEDGIGSSVHFRPVHQFPAIARLCEIPRPPLVADRLATRTLSLPLHPGLSNSDVDRVVVSLAGALS